MKEKKDRVDDALHTTCATLQHATSIFGLMITTEAMITEISKDTPAENSDMGGGMPGMM